MEVFSTFYDKTPKLDKDAYTFVRVSCSKPPENCHRHLIGEFLGIRVEEI